MRKILYFIFLLPLVAPAQVQPYNQAILVWDAVTQMDDDTLAPGAVTYNVYSYVQGSTNYVRVVSGTSSTTTTRSNIPDGMWCWHVRAVVAGVEGQPSAPACKLIKRPTTPVSTTPAAVTGLTAT